MPPRKLPPEGTPEYEEIKRVKKYGGHAEKAEICRKYGIVLRSLEHVDISDMPDEQQEIPDPIIITPEIIKYKPPKPSKGDPETQIIHTGDGHAGKITPTFNPEVYKFRMEELFQSAISITELHRTMYPINDLVILNTGDNVQGENPHQGSKIGDVAMGARNQVTNLALPAWVSFIMSAREIFKTVRFIGVFGNHGRYDQLAPETSNWDLMLYDALQGSIGNERYDGIEISTSDEFYQIVDIQGYRFFLFHADQIRCQQGIPQIALKRRLDAWYIQFGGFDFAVCGHWHKRIYDEASSEYDLFMTGPLVSDDPWALARLGISSKPSAWTYGILKGRGLTWAYPLKEGKAKL